MCLHRVQLVADNTGGVIPGWAQLQSQLYGPCWPPMTLWFWWQTGPFVYQCSVQVRTREDDNGRKHKADGGWETAQQGHGSRWTAEWWVQLRTRGPPSLSFSPACHVSWCRLCVGIKTSLTLNKLKKSNKHRQQMYYATDSECTAIIVTP